VRNEVPVARPKTSKSGRTTALAAYRRDVAVLKALAVLDGRLPADVLQDALGAWLQGQPEDARAVVGAVERRLAREQGS